MRGTPPGQEVGRPQLCSLVGPPGPVGTTGHRTGSVPNARLCGALNPGPGEEAASGAGAGAETEGPNLPEDPSCGECRDRLLWLIRFIDFGSFNPRFFRRDRLLLKLRHKGHAQGHTATARSWDSHWHLLSGRLTHHRLPTLRREQASLPRRSLASLGHPESFLVVLTTGCPKCMGARDAVQHPTVPRMAPPRK